MGVTLVSDYTLFTKAAQAQGYTGPAVAELEGEASRVEAQLDALDRRADLFESDRATLKVQAVQELAKRLDAAKLRVGSELESRADAIEAEITTLPESPRAAEIRASLSTFDETQLRALFITGDREVRAAIANAPPRPVVDGSGGVSMRRWIEPGYVRETLMREAPEAAARSASLRAEKHAHAALVGNLIALVRRRHRIAAW